MISSSYVRKNCKQRVYKPTYVDQTKTQMEEKGPKKLETIQTLLPINKVDLNLLPNCVCR